MTKNVQIDIDQYDNGITFAWHDLDGTDDDYRKIFLTGDVSKGIGIEIWGDIYHLLNQSCENKVRLTIKYETK